MSRHSDTLSEANQVCIDEFHSTLDHWLHQRDQEDREYQDTDKSWISKQTKNGSIVMNERKL
jgi:hypothetical protein